MQLKSSTIASCDYDGRKNELTVEFKSGGTYTYLGVSQKLADGLIGAESAGKYLAQNIKNSHKFRKGE